MAATDAAPDITQWLNKAGLQTASSSNSFSPDASLQQTTAAGPGLVLQAMLADQQGLILLLQQLPQHKEAIDKLSSLFCDNKPPVPAMVAALSSISDAATAVQLQQLLKTLLQLMQPGSDGSTAAGAAIALKYLYDKRQRSWAVADGFSSELEMDRIILSLPNQLLLAKALEHSSNEVVETAVSMIQAWCWFEPWRRDDANEFVDAFDALMQVLRKELQQGTPWAAHWYLAAMQFSKYEPTEADYAALIPAAAAEIQSLQQGVQQCMAQSVYALATASCLANSDDRDQRTYSTYNHRRMHQMISHCSPAAALWLYGPEGLEAIAATAAQRAAATDTVVQGTKQVLAMLQQAMHADKTAYAEALGIVLKRVLASSSSSTGLADSDWLVPALHQATRPTGCKAGGWLFRTIIESVPAALQQQLVRPLLQQMTSRDAAVACPAAVCLKDALRSDPSGETDTFVSCLVQPQHWELLLQAWDSVNDTVAEAVLHAISNVCQSYAAALYRDAKPAPPHVLQTIEQCVQATQHGDLQAAEMMYHMASGSQQLLSPHVPALLSTAAAEGSPTQAAALAVICQLRNKDYTRTCQQLPAQAQADAMPAKLRLWLLGDGTTDHYIPNLGFPASFLGPGLASGPQAVDGAAAVAGGWQGQAAWEQRKKEFREASAVAAADRAAAVVATAADIAEGDAACHLPGFLVEFISSGYQVKPTNRQERWHQDVVVTVLQELAKISSVTVLAAVLQHGWLPALSAIEEQRSSCRISSDLLQAAAPEQAQQIVPLLLQQLADSSGPAAASAAKQARETMGSGSCVAGILAQQQHWQLLLQLLQHKEDTVVQTAVGLVTQVVVRSNRRSNESHVAELLLQMAEALQHGNTTAAKLFVKLTGASAQRPHLPDHSSTLGDMREVETPKFRLLLSLMPQLHAAGAAAHNSTSCRLAALQTLRVLCKVDEGRKALVKEDCSWLLELVQPQDASVTTEAAELAAAAAKVIRYVPWNQPGVKLLLSGNYTMQLLHVVLRHTEALQTASGPQRTHLRSCCKHIMEALWTLRGKRGGRPVIVKHMLLVLQAMQQCHDEAADVASDIALECLDQRNVHKILQQQHVDVLVRCLSSKHEASRRQATELLSDVAQKPQGCRMLLQQRAWDQLLAGAGNISIAKGNPEAAQIVSLIATALDHFYSMHSAGQVSDQLDEQVTLQHLQQLATAAVDNDTAAPTAAAILAEIGSKGSCKMQLQLAQVMPLLQKAVQQLQVAAEAARAKAERLQAAVAPGQPGYHYVGFTQGEARYAESRVEETQTSVQLIQGMLALAVEVVTGQLADAKRSMHEVAGQFAEQYAAYRALRSQGSGLGFRTTDNDGAQLVVDQAQLPAKRQQLGNISGSTSGSADLAQRKTQLQQQLKLRSDALVDALGELVATADNVSALQDLLQYAQ